jgi:hypothetical protein
MRLWALDTIHHAAFNKTVKCRSLYDPTYALKYTRDYTPSLLNVCTQVSSHETMRTRISKPSTFSCTLPGKHTRTLTVALNGTLPACFTVCSQGSSQDDLKYTLEHALKYTPNCTQRHTPTLLYYTPTSKLTRRSQVHSEYILKCTPGHVPNDALTCTRCHKPSLLECTLL